MSPAQLGLACLDRSTPTAWPFSSIFEAHQTMQQFMWQPNLLQVAKFSDAGMRRLQTGDRNEGSNI